MRGTKRKTSTTSKCTASCCSETVEASTSRNQNARQKDTPEVGENIPVLADVVMSAPPADDISSDSSEISVVRLDRGRKQKTTISRKRKRSPPPTRSSGSDRNSSDTDQSDSSENDEFDTILNDYAKSLKGNKGQSFSPLESPISTQIPLKLQKKIWRNKFVDFGALLPITFGHDHESSPFQLQVSQSNGNFNLVPAVKKQKIFNIDQWTTAFMRFVAIYANKYPLETSALMKYGELVRDLASKNANNAWSLYDFQFRSLREHVQIPWDQMHTEFWVRATTSSHSASLQPFRQNRRPGGGYNNGSRFNPRKNKSFTNSEFLPNTCWPFNRRGFCSAVKCFPHICGYCRGQHSAKSCSVGHKQDSNPTQQPPQFQPNPIRPKQSNKSK